MKRLLLTLLLSTAVLAGCDYFVDPVAYNDKIVALDDKAIKVYEDYVDKADNTDLVAADLDKLNLEREKSITDIKAIKTELEAMDGLRGDTSLRDVFVKDLDALSQTLDTEEKQLIDVWKSMAATEGNPKQEDTDKENALFKAITDRSDAIYKEVSDAQEAFATKHGYDLEAPKVQ